MNEYFVFLYGALSNKSILYRLFNRVPENSNHSIDDYEIQEDKEYGFETLFHKQGINTDGLLCVLTADEINMLDKFNYMYRRITINEMFVYFINPKNIK